jgi:hypothetical protein
MYSLKNKTWNELKVSNENVFDGRMCHSACILADRIYTYGGMRNIFILRYEKSRYHSG